MESCLQKPWLLTGQEMSMRAIDWFDWKTDRLLVWKRSKHGTLVLHRSLLSCSCWCPADFAIINVYLHCLNSLFFRMFLWNFYSSSKKNLTTRHHFVCKLSLGSKVRTCQIHQHVSLQYFRFLLFISSRYRENMFMPDLVLYTACFLCVCFYFWSSIKYWILSLLLLTLFALVQLGLVFLFVPSFWSESNWASLSNRQNCQLGSFCDICGLWRFCLHFRKAAKFAG